jgi:hypothetical protein
LLSQHIFLATTNIEICFYGQSNSMLLF